MTAEIVAMRIAMARGYNRLTQPELAKLIGVTTQTISNWEHGRRMPDADKIRLLCDSLVVSADWLLGMSDEMRLQR